MTLIAIVKSNEVDRITTLLDKNGYEGRYTLEKQSSNTEEISVVINEDYDDLSGLYEILNSEGIVVLDQYDTESPLYQSYGLMDEADCQDEEENYFPIPIPTHFVQDPIEDQL
ncbi:hypothetical protein [Tepidibacillus fermentans]|uniref:Uncharacterized protein n=1 Tax=Tepidibacillus fermentans TaxID=1281767 RepID=A0A4V2UT43_9BACI|nr:hypothetical protein [Tepidibacillus fermentans]TCS84069.1 hypothetical protein EDD72_102110 [Tepidibacillus fermentans]